MWSWVTQNPQQVFRCFHISVSNSLFHHDGSCLENVDALSAAMLACESADKLESTSSIAKVGTKLPPIILLRKFWWQVVSGSSRGMCIFSKYLICNISIWHVAIFYVNIWLIVIAGIWQLVTHNDILLQLANSTWLSSELSLPNWAIFLKMSENNSFSIPPPQKKKNSHQGLRNPGKKHFFMVTIIWDCRW